MKKKTQQNSVTSKQKEIAADNLENLVPVE